MCGVQGDKAGEIKIVADASVKDLEAKAKAAAAAAIASAAAATAQVGGSLHHCACNT